MKTLRLNTATSNNVEEITIQLVKSTNDKYPYYEIDNMIASFENQAMALYKVLHDNLPAGTLDMLRQLLQIQSHPTEEQIDAAFDRLINHGGLKQ